MNTRTQPTFNYEATIASFESLAGLDWRWLSTTRFVSTNTPQATVLWKVPQHSPRVGRGVDFAFTQYENLLRRLAD